MLLFRGPRLGNKSHPLPCFHTSERQPCFKIQANNPCAQEAFMMSSAGSASPP